jgi:hypothetical protein
LIPSGEFRSVMANLGDSFSTAEIGELMLMAEMNAGGCAPFITSRHSICVTMALDARTPWVCSPHRIHPALVLHAHATTSTFRYAHTSTHPRRIVFSFIRALNVIAAFFHIAGLSTSYVV